MTKRVMFVALVGIALAAVGCGGNKESTPPAAGKLTLSLDPALDGGGDVKATSFAKVELLDGTGALVKTATLSGGAAAVDLAGVAAGDYFLRVNDLGDDLVPTRLDDPSKDMTQFVGQKLRHTVIGPDATVANATYNIKTFSKGQAEHQMVKYSDGTAAPPERYNYAIVSFKIAPPKIEIRLLGTGVLVLAYSNAAGSPHTFASWILGDANHGKPTNYTSDAACNGCHGSLDAHPGLYANVTANNGWCFKCHYSKGGDPNGFVDGSFGVASPGTLTLALDASLDGGGTVKATSITSADLLDTAGTILVGGTLSGGNASFSLANVGPGDYFIEVNGLGDDVVPTRIVDQSATVTQFVGQKLRHTVIGPDATVANATYNIKTYSFGQGEHELVKFSDLTNVAGAYGYAVVSMKASPAKLETKVLGSAAPLVAYNDGGAHIFTTWILGSNNHGVNYGGNDTLCTGCHTNMNTKAATYDATTPTNGWCYKCHAGNGGDASGLIDPTK